MVFNSFEFLIFLPITFLCYWFVFQGNRRWQNAFLIAASYLFYGWWDWRFLSLIIFSSALDFALGQKIEAASSKKAKKRLLSISLFANLGLLGVFKYFNFFIDSFVSSFAFFGAELNSWTLNIILPVGISFYTFQTLSYTIDVYRGRLKPTDDPISFFAFVSFFPQLVAGPIERATDLLPQFEKERKFDYQLAIDGLGQSIWGMFKKVVIADSCAPYVNDIFAGYLGYSGTTLFLGAVLFSIQIYADFSGYSDIAIGISKFFGFKLKQNFAFPYFSRDMGEFWRRWHISLSSWFRDYLYIPLGGSKGGRNQKIRNTFIIFIVSGFWHGANWTFIVWGALNALCFLPLLLSNTNRKNLGTIANGNLLPSLGQLFQVLLTFILVTITWIFFRAENVSHAFNYITQMFITDSTTVVNLPKLTIIFILFLFFVEWLQREKEHGLSFNNLSIPPIFKWGGYYVVTMLIILFYKDNSESFIYFQF